MTMYDTGDDEPLICAQCKRVVRGAICKLCDEGDDSFFCEKCGRVSRDDKCLMCEADGDGPCVSCHGFGCPSCNYRYNEAAWKGLIDGVDGVSGADGTPKGAPMRTHTPPPPPPAHTSYKDYWECKHTGCGRQCKERKPGDPVEQYECWHQSCGKICSVSRQSSSSSTGYGGYSGSGGYVWSKCTHTGDEVLFTIGDVTFGGAAGMDIPDQTDASLILDLSGGSSRFDGRAKFPSKYKKLAGYVTGGPRVVPRIELPWPDMDVPPVDPDFFRLLPDMVGKGHVVINCMGGHGRTGTALAALLIVHNPGMTARKAIEYVREHHCSRAVESSSQVQWLCDLAGFGEVVTTKGPKEGSTYKRDSDK